MKHSIRLLIVGDVSEVYKDRLNSKINGDDIFYSKGIYSNKYLESLFRKSFILIYPEGVGLAGLHAMKFGLPVISHNDMRFQKPEFEAILELDEKLCFERNNLNSLCNTINYVLSMNVGEFNKLQIRSKNIISQKWNVHNQLKIIQENFKHLK
jgi:glycosyltransferase involved in cell wall biosynthesis